MKRFAASAALAAMALFLVAGSTDPAGAAAKPSAKAACTRALKQANLLLVQVGKAVQVAQGEQKVVSDYLGSRQDQAATSKALTDLGAIVLPNQALATQLQTAADSYSKVGDQCAKALGISPKDVSASTATTLPAK